MFAKVAVLALFIAAAAALEFENCAPDSGVVVTSVTVQGCDAAPCTFVQGMSYDIEVKATSDRASTKLPYVVSIKILGADVPVIQDEACDYLTEGSCPISAGASFTFTKKLEVTDNYPPMETKMTAKVSDDAGQVAVCAAFDIVLVKP